MKRFKVRTMNHNTLTITARSTFHGRKLFAAKHEKAFGKLTSIIEIWDKKKPAIKIIKADSAGRKLT